MNKRVVKRKVGKIVKKKIAKADKKKVAKKKVVAKVAVKKSPKGPKARNKVEKVMHEFKAGELPMGKSKKKVKSRKQAIAIALSEARKASK